MEEVDLWHLPSSAKPTNGNHISSRRATIAASAHRQSKVPACHSSDTLDPNEGLRRAYYNFINRNSRLCGSHISRGLKVIKDRKFENSKPSKQNKRKIVWCLLLSIALLLVGIGFFAATACVSFRDILEKVNKNADYKFNPAPAPQRTSQGVHDQYQSNQQPNKPMERMIMQSFNLNPAVQSYQTTTPASTRTSIATERQIRIKNSSGWIEAPRNILSNIDFDADPCEDFYQYACGVWSLKNPLGPNESSRTVYTTVAKTVSKKIQQTIEQLDVRKNRVLIPKALDIVKFAYEACTDLDRMSKDGPKDLLKLLSYSENGIGDWPLISSITNKIRPEQSISMKIANVNVGLPAGPRREINIGRSADQPLITANTVSSTSDLLNRGDDQRYWINGTTPDTSYSLDNHQQLIRRLVNRSQRKDSDQSADRNRYPNFARTIGTLKNRYGIDTLIFTYVGPDGTKSVTNALQLGAFMLPLGLGQFKALYYLNDKKYRHIISAYKELINTTGNLLLRDAGYGDKFVNYTQIDDLVNFERQLAAHVQKAEVSPDRKWSLEKLIKEMPFFDWKVFFKSLLSNHLHGLLENDELSLDVPSKKYLLNVLSLISRTEPRIVQNYLIWRLVKHSMPYLGKEYRDALQKLNNLMSGAQTPKPINESCIDYIQGRYDMPGLGYATGRIFIDRAFSKEAKSDAESMIKSILDSFQIMVKHLDWMDRPTKRVAIDKAQTMVTHIAYPEWIKDNKKLDEYYSKLSVGPEESMFWINLKLRAWSVNKNQLELLTPTDRMEFGGPPSATNAWYSVANNALTVPAGELQPPFYKAAYQLAVKYGAAGSMMGHEITHGFDSQGSRYDAKGHLRRWWSAESIDKFERRTKCLEQEYSRFCYPEYGRRVCVDGEQTLGENVADLGGLKAAYAAYKKLSKREESMSTHGPDMHFTHDQLFFLSFASFWCGNSTEADLRDQLLTNRHAPARYRVIGTLRNTPAFAAAFQCLVGSFMNPKDKCEVW